MKAKFPWLQNPSEIKWNNLNNKDVKPADASGLKEGKSDTQNQRVFNKQ
jgi:hypothetical protein